MQVVSLQGHLSDKMPHPRQLGFQVDRQSRDRRNMSLVVGPIDATTTLLQRLPHRLFQIQRPCHLQDIW